VDFDFATRCRLRTAVTASQFVSGVQLDARASRDGYNSVRQLLSVDNAGFKCFGAETSPRLLFYHFRYSGMSLLSIIANSSNVSYALSAMDAVLLGRLQFSSNG